MTSAITARFATAVFIVLTLLSTSCSSQIRQVETPSLTSSGITSTLAATFTLTPSETPLPPSAQPTMIPVEGMTFTQVNVRAEPSTASKVLGIISANTKVEIIGKDANGTWLQIDFPQGEGPQGKGWVNAAFVQAKGVENLPIITEAGVIVGTGTPTGVSPTPTATLVPAWEDNDSPDSPVASVIFEPAGTQTLIYNGDLSVPQGDPQDWIAFKPYGLSVFISLDCKDNEALKIDITENTQPASLHLACGEPLKQIPVKAGSNYVIHLQALPTTGNLQYINYTLTIKARP